MTDEWNVPASLPADEWLEGLTAVPGIDPGGSSLIDPGNRVLFVDANVFDGTTDGLSPHRNVLVEGNVIGAISEASIEVPGPTRRINCTGKTLMPGLIDGHCHLAIPDHFDAIEKSYTAGDLHLGAAVAARHMILDGFTTGRDMGGPAFALKRNIDAGRFIGPRIYPSGAFISQTSGHGDFRHRSDPHPGLCKCEAAANFHRFGIGQIADGDAEVLMATRQNLMQGASQIKIMAGGGGASAYDPIDVAQYTEHEMKAAVDAARDWNTYVGAHIFTDKAIRRFVGAGGKSIEHGFFMGREAMELVSDRGVYVVPQMWGMSPELFNNPLVAPSKHDSIKAMQDTYKKFAPWLLELNVDVVFASDLVGTVPDAMKSRRYELYWRTQAFGSNFEVLRQATSTAGKLLAESGPRNPYPGKLGVIEVGALADILVIDGNPLADITVLGATDRWFTDPANPAPVESIEVIMKDGTIIKNLLV